MKQRAEKKSIKDYEKQLKAERNQKLQVQQSANEPAHEIMVVII